MKKLLIVEGNLSEENNKFSAEGIQTHTESLKDSLNYYTKDLPPSHHTVQKILYYKNCANNIFLLLILPHLL